jgi:hypothetical protein
MKNVKVFLKTGCLIPASIVIVGLLFYFIWTSAIAPRFSALGACDKDAGCLYTAYNGNRSVRVIGYSADGSRFLTDGTDDAIIHDAANGRKITGLAVGRDDHSYTITGDRSQIAAYRSDSIKFFDWDGELLRTWTPDTDNGVLSMAMVPLVDGFVIANKTGVTLWSMADGSLITRLLESGGIKDITASADGEYVAAYNFVDDKIIIWPLQNLDKMVVIEEVEALSIHLSADGSLLAAGGPGGAYVWHTDDGTLVTALEPDGQKATATGFSQDGTRLAVGFENGMVTVLDLGQDKLIATFEHEYPPRRISFTPDSQGLAVGLAFDVAISGGELIFRPRTDNRNEFRPGEQLRTSQNRQTISPGYAIVWSLAD